MNDGIDMSGFRAYVLDKFRAEGDFEFLKPGELEAMLDAMMALDEQYIKKANVDAGEVYDDDDAYELISAGLKERFPNYAMYCMRLTEDYLDFSEEYLASIGAIDWE